ncbi:dyslexia-associated protein KIAA0319 isoform X2 [Siniperca chuatsi]|uniref:dyslexia-associated protein KIAA0319 isoform X2 n=1 Tax=Siniperca chuatsi TaxID=119488 RepID=UPI001CE118A2|nr:dyslexia-associated protein KIAA0319 isoform X2 [Siniperca chuatsi]
MWRFLLLLLLHSVEAVVASQCRQGATFSEAVVSPAVESSSILRVPGVASLLQCVAACCDLPGYDLAWLFEGRCYILSCQQRENCQPRQRPGADSVLVFLRRASPQTLVLQSLVRGEPYGRRWRPLSRSSEAPGDLEALKDLALFDGPRQDFADPGVLDVDYSEGSQEERGWPGSEVETMTDQPSLKGRDGFNQSEAGDGPERGPTESSVAQNRTSSGGNSSQGDEDKTRSPTDPAAAEKTTETQSSTESTSLTPLLLQKPTTDSAQQDQIRTSLPTAATPHWPISTSIQPDRPLMVSLGNPVERMLPAVKFDASVSPEPTNVLVKAFQSAAGAPQTTTQPQARARTSDPPTTTTTSTPSTNPPTVTVPSATTAAESVSEVRGSNRGPVAVVGPDRKLFLPVSSLSLDGSGSTDDRGIVSYHWDAVSGPPGLKLEGVDQAVATATGLRVGRYTLRLTVSDQEGATGSASLTVRVQEARSLPPVAHASGSHTLALPNNSLVLRGSVTDGDQTEVRYLWVRDSQSPAAGDALYGSETQASLYLANLVEGTYLFQLRVTDAQGRSCTATATVEVRPVCLLRCSGRGQCDPITKECTCDPFWTENLIRRYLGDGESNCDWRVLYVILTSFMLVVFILSVGWTVICCCKRRRQTKVRKKTKYTILDNMDEQERVELRPKFSIKHRSTEHNSSLMMSESELDSDQDTIFSRDRPVRSRNRLSAQAARNGNAFG